MGCISTFTLTGITYTCEDVPVGGLNEVWLGRKDEIDTIDTETSEGTVTTITFTKAPVQLEFNNKDAFTNFTDVKTVDPTGSVSTVPTITIEFPTMTVDKRNELNGLSQNGLELVAYVLTAAGTYHAVGLEFGLYGQTVNGQSGTGRAEKNVYQFTLTGEETNLALDAEDIWTDVIAGTP